MLRILNSDGFKVFFGTSVLLSGCAVTFYGFGSKSITNFSFSIFTNLTHFLAKAGHGTFDVDKPEAVQKNMEEAQKRRLSKDD